MRFFLPVTPMTKTTNGGIIMGVTGIFGGLKRLQGLLRLHIYYFIQFLSIALFLLYIQSMLR